MKRKAPCFRIPEPLATADLAMVDGAAIRLRRHGNPDGPRIALSHGNGLATDAYFPFWDLFRDRYDIVLFDARNHGQNPLHGREAHTWPNIAGDLETVYRGIGKQFGDKRIAGIFHSMSSVAATDHVLTRGRRWDPLVLIDLPIMPPEGHPLESLEREHMREMSALAARRPQRYARPSDLAAQLASRPQFSRWLPGAHDLLARATLRNDEHAGDWTLACPRELESFIFASNTNNTLWPRMGDIEAPILLIGADPAVEDQQAPAFLTESLAGDQGLDYVMVPGTTHFLQIERPREAYGAVEAFFRRHGFADW